MDEGPPHKCPPPGAPAWVMTFADLMSLLMCFFVLLLAFSEMDVLKFKQLAGSMKEAFGVQREVNVKEIPKGTSIIAREFSPGRPEPTLVKTVQQRTIEQMQQNLQLMETTTEDSSPLAQETTSGELDDLAEGEADARAEEIDDSDIRTALSEDIDAGLLEVDTEGQRIIIRIRERGSFPSGAADLMRDFEPVLARIGAVLEQTAGRIIIAGHSDDIPIRTARFRSNWELSASRAVSVVQHLGRITDIPMSRFLIEGHAETQPLVPNEDAESRARNRRVEIVVVRGSVDEVAAELNAGDEPAENGGPAD